MKKLFLSLFILVFVAGCSWTWLPFIDEDTTTDQVEVGLYKSLESTAVAYQELTEYLVENQHLFSEEDKQKIEEYARVYRYAYHSALDAWMSYKLYGEDEQLTEFITSATDTIKSFTELYNLVRKEE